MSVDNIFFSLYYDENMKQIYLKINNRDIVAINKRQINRYDVNKFSVYYKKNEKSNNIIEIKLKAQSRREADIWIQRLRFVIKPNKFVFKTNKGEAIKTIMDEILSTAIFKKQPNTFYIFLKKIEHFINRKNKLLFFHYLKIIISSKHITNEYNHEANLLDSINADIYINDNFENETDLYNSFEPTIKNREEKENINNGLSERNKNRNYIKLYQDNSSNYTKQIQIKLKNENDNEQITLKEQINMN